MSEAARPAMTEILSAEMAVRLSVRSRQGSSARELLPLVRLVSSTASNVWIAPPVLLVTPSPPGTVEPTSACQTAHILLSA